jgi:hypothetical protein
MSSWVRYSIAVYVGLLISGALARQPWQGPPVVEPAEPSVYQDTVHPAHPLPQPVAPKANVEQDVAV